MGELFVWMAIAGILVIIGVGIWCLWNCEGKARKYLVLDTIVFLVTLALHFGGSIVLGFLGLAWRNVPGMVLWMILVGSFLIWIVLALCCFLPQTDEIGWVNQGIVILFAVVTFLVVLWVGLIVLAFGYGGTEQVLEYQGQTLVERMEGFLSPDYSYYKYYGPLVRGTERLWNVPSPIGWDIN